MESFGVAQIIQNANLQRKYRPPPHRRHFLYSNFSLKVVDIWNGMVYNTKAIEGRAVLFHKRESLPIALRKIDAGKRREKKLWRKASLKRRRCILVSEVFSRDSGDPFDQNRGVAQFGRVLGSGPRGRRFKSSHSDHVGAGE